MPAFLILALLGLAGSAFVHARSFVADDGIGQAASIAMFAGVFVAFVPAIATAPPPDDPQYGCRDCGHVEPLGFRGGVGGASAY